jgi:hypothetical protein
VENIPASIPQVRRARAQAAEIAALRRENDRLRDPDLPEYVRLCGTLTKGSGLTVDQTIDLARDMHEYADAHDMPLCRDMVQAYFEYWEGRALARRVAENSPHLSPAEGGELALVLAFRKSHG